MASAEHAELEADLAAVQRLIEEMTTALAGAYAARLDLLQRGRELDPPITVRRMAQVAANGGDVGRLEKAYGQALTKARRAA